MWGLVLVAAASCSEDGDELETIFVDERAEVGGDGSENRPLRDVGAALTLVPAGGLVYVAAGTYSVPAVWEFEAPVSILGALGSSTHFVADQGDRVQWSGNAGDALSVRDITFDSAVAIGALDVELHTVEVSGTGPALSLANATAEFIDVVVHVGDEAGLGEYDDDSVLVQNSTLTWTGGSATDGPDRGLVVEGSRITLGGVALSSGTRAALHIAGDSECTATEVAIEDAGLAVFIQNSSLHLIDSNIARTRQTSILGGTASEVLIEGSTFEDSPSGFIASSLNAASLTIRDSSFLRAVSDNCITASAGAFTATGNTIHTCAGSGISAIGVDVEILDNDIQNIQLDLLIGVVASAISLSQSTGTISENSIADTVDSGINIINSSVVASGNRIGPIGGAGISHVDGPVDGSSFTGNTIEGATGAGIIMLNASGDAKGNTIRDTQLSASNGFGDGIVFGSSAEAVVQDNTISGSAHSGVLFLNGAVGHISGNTATANGQYGISELCLDTPNQVSIGENTLGGNTAGESQICSP